MLLATLNRVTRKALRTDRSEQGVLKSLSQFDIHDTAVELRHEFCTLWNEIVEKARNGANEEARITAAQILTEIHHLFADLHQDTDSAPIRFPAPISGDDNVLSWPWSYRPCSIRTHHPNSAADNHTTTSPIVPSLTQPSDSPNAPLHSTSPGQLSPTASRDLATEDATAGNADMSVTSAIADPVRFSNSGGSSALQQAEETGTIPPPFVSGSLPTPIMTPALRNANSDVLPPSIYPAPMQTDHVQVPDQYPDARVGTTGAQRDNQDTHFSILSEDHRQSPPGGPTVSDILGRPSHRQDNKTV
jgi:hypothetical protein